VSGGWGIGDWGLGIGDWAQSPIPNPQSPIPNPQSPFFQKLINIFYLFLIINLKIIKFSKKKLIIHNIILY